MTQAKTVKVAVEDIEMSRVALDGGTQTRETLIDALALEDYVAAIERGDELPPIDVVDDGERYYLVDGFHRYAAHAQLRRAVIRARVVRGTRSDAIWYASRANATHGLRRTNADKRRAVRLALEHPLGARMSNAAIAKHCHVHDRLVASVRDEIERDDAEKSATEAPQKRIGADGRERPAKRVRAEAPAATTESADVRATAVVAEAPTAPVPPSRAPQSGAHAQAETRPRAHDEPRSAAAEAREQARIDDRTQAADEREAAGGESVSVIDAQSRGGVAIGLLAPRAKRMRQMLVELMRESSSLRSAITRIEARDGAAIVPRAVSSAWPIARALHAVVRELDELEPRGPCAACLGAGCDRCGTLGWVPVARGDR